MRISRFSDATIALLALTVITLLFLPSGLWGQTAPVTGAAPTAPRLQAELLKTIDASHAKVGDEVTARTVTPLEFDGAKFPAGSTVIGHVTEANPERLVLLFDHMVVKKNAPVGLGLSLRAVVMPTMIGRSTGEQISPRAQGLGATPGDPGTQNPLGGGGPMRSPEVAVQDSAVTVFQGPRSVETGNGGAVGLPGVQFAVSDDPKVGASFQVAKDHKLQLEKGLQMMFVVSK